MKKNIGETRVSPASVKWVDEMEYNESNRTKDEGNESVGGNESAERKSKQMMNNTKRTLKLDQQSPSSEAKITTSNVKVAFSKDSSTTSATSKTRLILTSIGKFMCLSSCFGVEFYSGQLEQIYQHYYCRQKLDRILCIIFLDFALNLCLIAMYSVVLKKNNPSQLIVTCIFGMLNLMFIAVYFLKLLPRRVFRWLPYVVWFAVFCQLQVDLVTGYNPLVPSDSVGMFLFFIFISNVMLPASLAVCLAFSLLAAVGHVLIMCVFATRNREHLGRQVSSVVPVCICNNTAKMLSTRRLSTPNHSVLPTNS